MEFTEAESNMNDLVSEYQQYQVPGGLRQKVWDISARVSDAPPGSPCFPSPLDFITDLLGRDPQ